MRLLTGFLTRSFAGLLADKRIQRVDIATAWATDGPGLDSLEAANVKVRTLVGIAGGHTTPTALERLGKLGDVRLVDDGGSLFHVKLYLFHGRRTSFAWTGSANFTRSGFEKNEELLFEVADATEAVAWFENRWQEVDAAQSRKRLDEYCRTWKRPPRPLPGVDDDRWIVFTQEGARPPPRVAGGNNKRIPAKGRVKIAGKEFSYKSAQRAAILVFTELQRRDRSFLAKCEKDPRFSTGRRKLIAPGKRRSRYKGLPRVREGASRWMVDVQPTSNSREMGAHHVGCRDSQTEASRERGVLVGGGIESACEGRILI